MNASPVWIRSAWHVLATAAIVWMVLARFLTGAAEGDAAKAYPRRPIKVVVPFGAGGGSDTFVRLIQKTIVDESLLAQPLVVINRGGGSATIGSRSVKIAKASGYTLLNLHDSIFTARLSGKVPYGPEAFEPIAATGRVSMVVVVADGSPYRSLADLMEAARHRPGTVGFGANMGSPSHFSGLLLEKSRPGARFRYIQSGGGQQRYTKLIGNHIDVGVFSIDEFVTYGADGSVRALAVLGDEREPSLQNVPTAVEQGFDVVHHNTQYWWAPKGTPPARVEIFADVLHRAMQSPAAQAWFKRNHIEPLFAKGQRLEAMLRARGEALQRVDLRKPVELPNFPAIVGAVVGVLWLGVAVSAVRERRSVSASPGASASVEDASAAPRRPALAWGFVALALLYALSMELRFVAFAWATAVFVFASGALLGRRKPEQLLVLAQLALIVGLGAERLFTDVFVIDLPGAEAPWKD